MGSRRLFKIRLKIFPRLSVVLFYTSDLSTTLAKSAYQNIDFLISQPKIMLSTKAYLNEMVLLSKPLNCWGKKLFTILRSKIVFP